MGNRRIKFLAGITVSALVISQFGMLPAYASVDFPLTELEDEKWDYTSPWDEDGFRIQNGVITSYNGDNVDVYIKTLTGTLEKVTEIGYRAFSGQLGYPNEKGLKVEIVRIPRGITKISDGCFDGCTNLREVIFIKDEPYGDDDRPFENLVLGDSVFRGCTSLKRIDLSDLGRVSQVGKSLFEGCTSLEEAILSEGMTEIPDSMFKDCTSLKYIKIPGSIKKIADNAFDGTSDLTIFCEPGSAADDFAKKHGIRKRYITSSSEKMKQNITLGVPMEDGKIVRYLDEGDFYLDPSSDGDGTEFEYKVIGTSTIGPVCSVSEDGFVTILGVGEATIQVKVLYTNFFATGTLTVDIVIKDREKEPEDPENPENPEDPPSGDDKPENPDDDPGKSPGGDSNTDPGDGSGNENGDSGFTLEQKVKVKNIEVTYGDAAFFISPGSDMGKKVTYSSSNKKVFTVNKKGKITIKGCGSAKLTMKSKTAKKSFQIVVKPRKNEITALQIKKRNITVKWKRDKKADGYYIYYSTNSNFKKSVNRVKVSKNKNTQCTIKKLKSGKKYYIRMTSYKKSGSKIIESDFSKIRSIKVK